MAQLGFHFRVAAAALLLLAGDCAAQDSEFGETFGVIDTVFTDDFSPSAAFILQEVGLAEVRRYRAAIEAVVEKGKTGLDQPVTAVAAPVPPVAAGGSFRFTFFLADEGAHFRSTPVKLWTQEDLQVNTLDRNALERDMRDLEEEIKTKRIQSVELQDAIASGLAEASRIAEVEQLLQLKRQLLSAQRGIEEQQAEIERLEELIETGRQLEEVPGVDAMRKELSIHLREAAKVTALADRLNNRRRQAAQQSFNQKLSMVKKMEREDPEELAREVLRWRKRRRELEARLGTTAAAEEQLNDF